MIRTESGIELKKKLLEGIETVNKAVSSTLGPSGRNVLIHGADGVVRITKDGATVAASFSQLDGEVQNVSAQLIRQVAINTADKAGDGTTTATLLAASIVSRGIKSILQGNNAVEVKKGIDIAIKATIEKLRTISKEITSEEQLKHIASISANNDTEIGNIIATAIDKVGKDGMVTIEQSKGDVSYLDTVEGIQFDRGYKSPFFVTDNSNNNAILDDPFIFIYDDVITSAAQLLPLLTAVTGLNKSILIIGEVEAEALAMLIVNKQRGMLKAIAVKAPEFGDRRDHILEDIAIMTGGRVFSKKKGDNIEKIKNFPVDQLGRSRKVTVTKDQTTIIDGKGNSDDIIKRIEDLKSLYDNAKSPYEIETIQSRLAKMTGGVAIIYVGGVSEVEMKEKHDRIEDALHATRAAVLEGYVPGGGLALMNCVPSLKYLKGDNLDQDLGIRIVIEAIQQPFIKILSNAGIENHYEIWTTILMTGDENTWIGYNVKTGVYEDFNVSGVIDPTKVTRTALENAASIAGTILTTDSIIYLKEDKSRTEEA